MTARDPDLLIKAFFTEGDAVLPGRVIDGMHAEIARAPRSNWRVARVRLPARAGAWATLGLTAVAVIAVVGVAMWSGGRSTGVGGPGASDPTPAGSSTAPAEPTGHEILGLPFPPPTPGTTEAGTLVLGLTGNLRGPMWEVQAYADGRLLWFRSTGTASDTPAGGMYEQRLSPSGIDYLRSAALATGLFAQDLALARPTNAPFLSVDLRNGDRLVHLVWAIRANYLVGTDAPVATEVQAAALEQLFDLVTSPGEWPASAWADREVAPYAAGRYGICLRLLDPSDPLGEPGQGWDRVTGYLPAAAQQILDEAPAMLPERSGMGGPCVEVTTADAYAVAVAFEGAGIRRVSPNRSWIMYVFDDPDLPGQELWITFGAIGPDGRVNYFGPG